MTVFMGIDPGLNGGFGIIREDKIFGIATPTFWRELKSGKKRKQYDFGGIAKIIKAQRDRASLEGQLFFLALEEQFPMPMMRQTPKGIVRQGAVSVFSTGFGYGMYIGMLRVLDIKQEDVHAKTWQSEFFTRDTSMTTKAQALEALKALYPNVDLFATERSKKAHEGIVDALLIGEWMKRKKRERLKK
jgi:hypothetical protein